MRKITYAQAINEAQHIAMSNDPNVIQIGQGINSPWYVGNTMLGLIEKYGAMRLIDTPISENALTGMAIGASLMGLKPIVTFPRMDFMYYAMDQICNHAAILDYTLGGNARVDITIRAIINRKGEQGAQHSQALHGLFNHIPGMKIVMPSNAYDAKGMLLSAISYPGLVLYIEDSELYKTVEEVPEASYNSSLDMAKVLISGNDLTIVACSTSVKTVMDIIPRLNEKSVSIELIDLRSIKPIDIDTILPSVAKTRNLLVVDGGWKTGGVAAEIIAQVTENLIMPSKPVRLTLPDLPAPASKAMEDRYYISQDDVFDKVIEMLGISA